MSQLRCADHISAAQVGEGGPGLDLHVRKPGSRHFDKNNLVIPYVTLTGAYDGYPAMIDDQRRVTFTADVRALGLRLSRLVEWRMLLVDDPWKRVLGYGPASLDVES